MCKCVLYIICSPLCRMGSLLYMLHPSVATLTWLACYWTEDLRLMLKRGQVSRLTHDSYIFFLCPPSLMKPSQVKFLSSSQEGQRITSLFIIIISISESRCEAKPGAVVYRPQWQLD